MLWEFRDSCWEQDDNSKTFKIRKIFGQECEENIIAPLCMLIGAKTHPINGENCDKSMFPADFLYCPHCGTSLTTPDDQCADLWVPPYGSGNGLKIFPIKSEHHKKIVTCGDKATKLLLPSPDGHFAFCSIKFAAQQRLLIALRRDIGQLWIFCPEEKKWKMLSGNFGGDSLPTWSWSLASDLSESGLMIPTDQGPVWITVNWASNSIQIDRGQGCSIGGAVRIGKYILSPVLNDNRFSLLYRKEGENIWSEFTAASDPLGVLPQLRRSSNQDAYLGIPIVDNGKQIAYWPGRGGYVRASCADSSSKLNWEFRPYETDEYPATALIELGPPYRRIGSRSGFWQLCEDRDHTVRDGIVNKIIKLDGDELVDSEIVECGQFLTTGRASFSWNDDYWDDIHKRNSRINEQTELRYPLLQFGEKGLTLIAKVIPWEGRDELGVFTDLFSNHWLQATTFVRFVIEGAGIPEKPLYAEGVDGNHDWFSGSLFRVKVSELLEIKSFIYGNALCIYLPEKNDCFCWPLELFGSNDYDD